MSGDTFEEVGLEFDYRSEHYTLYGEYECDRPLSRDSRHQALGSVIFGRSKLANLQKKMSAETNKRFLVDVESILYNLPLNLAVKDDAKRAITEEYGDVVPLFSNKVPILHRAAAMVANYFRVIRRHHQNYPVFSFGEVARAAGVGEEEVIKTHRLLVSFDSASLSSPPLDVRVFAYRFIDALGLGIEDRRMLRERFDGDMQIYCEPVEITVNVSRPTVVQVPKRSISADTYAAASIYHCAHELQYSLSISRVSQCTMVSESAIMKNHSWMSKIDLERCSTISK